jgi:hypothetical protein
MSGDHGHAEQVAVPVATHGGLTRQQLLLMYGFVKDHHKEEYKQKIGHYKSDAKRRAAVRKIDGKKLKEMVLDERAEIVDGNFDYTGYPAGAARFRLMFESSSENVEDSYFLILELIRQQFGFPNIHKTTDYFAASENSAFFGNSQQRLGIQQDRVQQFLANIGKFVKELFQMVRELRIIDERLAIYEAAMPDGGEKANPSKSHNHTAHEKKQHSHAADVTLKSIFTDVVEGGTKNPQSVFGLASQVNFTLLPDLFFNEYVAHQDQVDARVDSMQYNKSLKAVLKRKLFQYLVWKEKTYNELKVRRSFNLKYLRQHWTIIKMYIAWVKPYLRTIQRLTMNASSFDSPDLIAAFETALIEVEFVAYRPAKGGYHPTIVASFVFRSRPDMSVRREYQQGPVHMGRMDLNLRAYSWSPEQIENYKKLKQREEIELLGLLDSSLGDIMDSLGDDFENYLKEAGEDIDEKEQHDGPPPPRPDGALAPFASIFGGFKDMFEAFIPSGGSKDDHHGHGSPSGAFKDASSAAANVYHVYKKNRRMVTW